MVDGGWQFHDWSEYQPSRDSVEDRRARDRDRKAAARAAHQRKRETSTQSPQGVRAESAETPQGIREESALPDPTRPDPTNKESVPARAKRKRPARSLPDCWEPRQQEIDACIEKDIDPNRLAADMRNWAQAKDERRADWDATFRTFISRETRPSGGVARHSKPSEAEWWEQQLAAASQPPEDHRQIENWRTA